VVCQPIILGSILLCDDVIAIEVNEVIYFILVLNYVKFIFAKNIIVCIQCKNIMNIGQP